MSTSVMKDSLRLLGAYAVAVALLTYYGSNVCPYLESLKGYRLAFVLAGACAVGFFLRSVLILSLRRREAAQPAQIDLSRPWRVLLIDMGSWLFAGSLMTVWTLIVYRFPASSGLKLLLGCITLGIFSSIYSALETEREFIFELSRSGRIAELRTGRFLSITTRFFSFIAVSFAVFSVVLGLLIYKDVQWIVHCLQNDLSYSYGWIAEEVAFVFGVLLVGSFILTRKYSRNLQIMFDLQLKALASVESGRYDVSVPIVSNDEFGLIAQKTNGMIVGLREKQRIKEAFGKYMSPIVAESILSSEKGADLGGRQAHVAILFADIRNYTPLSERLSPHEVVSLLNEYFTMIVSVIHRNCGVLDKFIGDAAMAVFGLDGKGNPSEAALHSAMDIQVGLLDLNRRLTSRGLPQIENGMGIHYGPVIAGNIGSQERLEYTVIGDTVNTAARLETLTKTLDSPIAVSEQVYNALSNHMREKLYAKGKHTLKGKAESVLVYCVRRLTDLPSKN